MSNEVVGYVILDKYEETIDELKSRKLDKYKLDTHPFMRGTQTNRAEIHIKDKDRWVSLNDWALINYLSRLSMNCNPQFIYDTLNIPSAEEKLNDIFGEYFAKRYQKKKGVDGREYIRTKPLLMYYVEDMFSLEGEIRYCCTTLHKPFPDLSLGEFVSDYLNNDWEFFESLMKPLMSRFSIISDKQIQIGDRTVRLGLCLRNSEFGDSYLDVGIFLMDVECTNQFISRNKIFHENIVHRRKDDSVFKEKLQKGFDNLSKKMDAFGKMIKNSNEDKLKIKTIEELRDPETVINKKFSQLADIHVDGIVDAFNADPVYDRNGNLTKWSLFSACTRYVRDNRQLEDNDSVMNAISSLI